MRIKLYSAPAMADAMRQVRMELGPEALILSSRRVADGVEVTAGLESVPEETPLPVPAAAPLPVRAAPRAFASAHGGATVESACQTGSAALALHDASTALAFHGASAALRQRLQRGPLAFALSAAFRFAALPLAPGGPPVLLAGPPGAGKTLSTARLATRLVMAGTAPLVVTADGQRAGATEQLAAFTRVLGLNLLVASQPAAMRRALAHRRDGAPVLVDAPGYDAFDPAQRAALAELAGSIGALVAVVLPAGMDPGEAAESAAALAEAGATLLVATRLDAARRIGSVLAAAEAGLALAEAGIGPGAADGMVPLTPALLARRLMQVSQPQVLEPTA